MPQVSPLLAQSVHLTRAIGILLCPIVRHWLTTLTSLRIFTSFTHMHTHLQNRHRTLTRGEKKVKSHLFLPVDTHIDYSDVVLSCILPLSQVLRLHFLRLIYTFSHTQIQYTNDIHTDMQYCTHKDSPPFPHTHSHLLACRLALEGVKWLNVLKALGKHGSSSAPRADIICPASLQSGVYIQLHL